ncbi:MAG: TetR/AcrR family transcriptional regulator [Bacteroidota bacterium]|jgi:AcrR family transcriptional regulator
MKLHFQVHIPSRMAQHDPSHSRTGLKILNTAIQLIADEGYESFHLSRLAEKADTVESTVYRYFENKHKLLLYISGWYWAYLDFSIDYETREMKAPAQILNKAIEMMAGKNLPTNIDLIGDPLLIHRIMITEFSKIYITQMAQEDNKEGYFVYFKTFVNKIGNLLSAIMPGYKFPRSFAFLLVLGIYQQMHVAEKLPALSDYDQSEPLDEYISRFIKDLISLHGVK